MANFQIFRAIRVFEVQVIRVGRMARTARRYHLFMTTHQRQKFIPCIATLLAQYIADDAVQLHAAYIGHQRTIVVHDLEDFAFAFLLAYCSALMFVVCLFTLAKQPTKSFHRCQWVLLGQAFYCLAPSFFNKSMPSSSFTISIKRS